MKIALWGICILFCGMTIAFAEVLELEGTVKAVDASARSITIERKTPKGTKTLELEVTNKAGDLSSVKAGDSISFSYDPDLELVTKIGAAGEIPADSTTEDTQSSEVIKGEPINIIAKDSLQGWRLRTPLPDPNWIVADGMLVCIGEGSDLLSEADFDDFEMTVEFLLPPKCNSGIYLRDQYEISLLDNAWRNQRNEPAPPNALTGGIYGRAAPSVNAYLGPSRWNKLAVRLVGDTVSAQLNGKAVLKNVKLVDEGEPVTALGPFRIQYHTATAGAKFRNWVITPLKTKD